MVVLVEWQCDSGFVKVMDSLSWLGRLDAMCMLWRGQHVQQVSHTVGLAIGLLLGFSLLG